MGIGASAGGLSALKSFFAHVPADSGLAFVVVVHLSPDHESHLADLLQPHVKMPVQQVAEPTPLEPDHVYVIPPGHDLSTIDTHLRLSSIPERRAGRAPIDHFLRTLARTHDGHAIGVILTGTGSDGALGIKAIKERGGLTVVQDPVQAEYDGMPQSAIATGLVDLVLPIEEIPRLVLRFARTRPRIQDLVSGEVLSEDARVMLQKVFAQIRGRTGRDFGRYKRSTILRRIARRMQLHHIEEIGTYVELLRDHPQETRSLADDLLITVTSFFRDPDVFERLGRDVIPALFARKGIDDDVRVWSIGCATGEEAYSLAILLLEHATRLEHPRRIQVFASDLHEASLERAREGFYPGDITVDVSPERLMRFFEKEEGGYRVRKELRELVVFAPHNLLGDPPFSRIDLISCRNLLIYLERAAQREVIELLHYALRPDGHLLLGSSETIEGSDLFLLEDKKSCLYRKRNVPAPEPRLPVFPLTRARLPAEVEPAGWSGEPMSHGGLHQRMVERYAPPSMLLSPDDKIVHLSEHAGRYLGLPGGEITANALKLVREELRVELRSSLSAARERREPVRSKPVPVRFDGEPRLVALLVRPALEPRQEGFVLVIFDEQPEGAESIEAPRVADGGRRSGVEADERTRQLERELDLARQHLQAVIEEYETSQEEMKASNEELQSTNEELRSTLEELETSKEELQSMNEELQTVNQENRHKVEELAQLSNDLQNHLAATEIATLFLDRELRILRFTPQVGALFNVRIADRGRPLSDLTHRLGYDELASDARAVLERLTPVEREVQDEAGRWYLTRVLPYRSAQDQIQGVVITMVDITSRKHAEEAVRTSDRRKEEFLAVLGHELRNPLAALCAGLELLEKNPGSESKRTREMMSRQVAQLVRLIDDLLDVSRIGRGRLELRLERTELATVVERALESSPVGADRELVVRLPDEPIVIEADPLRLAQVLGNLLRNAQHFTGPGDTIRLSVERQGSDAVVTVADSGAGIPADRLAGIFEMFSQSPGPDQRTSGGLGIGLMLVRQLVELHGGSVEARSAGPGRGSEFVVRLPLPMAVPPGRQREIEQQPASRASGLRILVVDDNVDAALTLAKLAELSGNEVIVVHDGEAALQAAEASRPDAVLLDIGLPKLDGYEVARRIRAAPWGRTTVLVAVTGWGQPSDRERSAAAGFDWHAVKPVTPDVLLRQLGRLCAGRGSGVRRPD